jgi:hypothetical protein
LDADHSFQRCHPHTEELVEVVGKYPKKFNTVNQGDCRVFSFLEHPAVKVHPADLPVNDPGI